MFSDVYFMWPPPGQCFTYTYHTRLEDGSSPQNSLPIFRHFPSSNEYDYSYALALEGSPLTDAVLGPSAQFLRCSPRPAGSNVKYICKTQSRLWI